MLTVGPYFLNEEESDRSDRYIWKDGDINFIDSDEDDDDGFIVFEGVLVKNKKSGTEYEVQHFNPKTQEKVKAKKSEDKPKSKPSSTMADIEAVKKKEATEDEFREVVVDDAMAESLSFYQGDAGYSLINGTLRKKVPESSAPTAWENVYKISLAIEKSTLPRDMVLYRKLKSGRGINLDNLTPGTEFEDRGFVSTTLTEEKAASIISGKVIVEILCRKGTQAICMNRVARKAHSKEDRRLITYDEFHEEQEVLLNRGNRFRVLDIKQPDMKSASFIDNYVRVQVEMVS